MALRRDACGEGQAELDGPVFGIGVQGTTHSSLVYGSREAETQFTVLFDPCPPGVEASRPQPSLGNQLMWKIRALPRLFTLSPNPIGTGGLLLLDPRTTHFLICSSGVSLWL